MAYNWWEATLTFALSRLLCHLPEDEAVGDNDDAEGKSVDSDHVEHVVGKFMGRRREEVEGDALGEPRVIRIVLHVENDTLKKNHKQILKIGLLELGHHLLKWCHLMR